MNRNSEPHLQKYSSAINNNGSLRVSDLCDTAYDSYGLTENASAIMDNNDGDLSSVASEDSGPIFVNEDMAEEYRMEQTKKFSPKLPIGKFSNYSEKPSFNPTFMSNNPNSNIEMSRNGVFVKTALYDTISPLRRPSEAEQKVEELTEKIEKEMSLYSKQLQNSYKNTFGNSQMNSQQMKTQVLSKQKSPPPYYGYHRTNTPNKKQDYQNFPLFYKNSNSEPRQLPSEVNMDNFYQPQMLSDYNDKFTFLGSCTKCKEAITDVSKACQALGQVYHTQCFTCFSCGRLLKDKQFYNVQGRVFCEEDYLYSGFQQTFEKCASCGQLIIEDILQAMGNSYHPRCFKCHICGICLDGVAFTIDVHNDIYCIRDYHSLYAPKCASCFHCIVPTQDNGVTTRVVSMERDFHLECFKCHDCHRGLASDHAPLCYPLNDTLLCKSCHLRRIT